METQSDKVVKFTAAFLGFNGEPKRIAEFVNRLVSPGAGNFEFTLSSCLALALWASRKSNVGSMAYVTTFLEAVDNQEVASRVTSLIPDSFSTLTPSFKPEASPVKERLETLLEEGGCKSYDDVVRDVLNFLAERNYRFN